MKRILIILSVVVFQSCASLVSTSKWPVTIASTPEKSTYIVTNRKGVEVSKGITPAVVSLKSSDGFFRRSKYTITVKNEGYDSLTYVVKASLNPWYAGNIVFGGAVGLLIVDPITGAMYKIKDPDIKTPLRLIQ